MSARTAPMRRMTAGSLGKMPTTRARRLISLLTRSSGYVDQVLAQWLRRNAVKASTSAFASSISGPILGKLAASWSRTVSQVAETASAVGWAKMVRNTAATMSLWDLVRALVHTRDRRGGTPASVLTDKGPSPGTD